ncbi:TOBE domain-containing protein [Phormidium yuhuli AB48]|uniref:TOBE domain-containing protein n=1 Tax=Phormidium yuhuli AB48 TaxID=2940671 RepID=A0ABY5AMQ4_9CYAN|nr:TOBE domain-containing protein [Phormidium yuhuli]USR90492.1 TOBE domain-containing protein [Phormidium yuhuli AB48]
MQVTEGNVLKGTIKHINVGTVNAEVTLEVNPGVEITAMVTKASVDTLQLSHGKDVYAVIQGSHVMIDVD